MAVSFLPDVLTGALLKVEVAWGADLTAADTTWTWTDTTSDVRLLPGIDTTNGRADEASTTQPAQCTLTLDNSAFKYSISPTSPNYPFVRRGTPVRISVRPSTAGAYSVIFQGGAVEWAPSWSLKGTLAEVKLTVAGTLRRLAQDGRTVLSSLRRALVAQASTVLYVPCEEGKTATRFEAAVGRNGMSWNGTPDLSSFSDFACSAPLPVMKSASFQVQVPDFTANATDGSMSVRGLFYFPNVEQVDQAPILRIYTTGTVAQWDFRYNVGGACDLKGYDLNGNLIVNQGAIAFGVKGQYWYFSVEMYNTGGTVFAGVNGYVLGQSFFQAMPAVPPVAGVVGKITKVVVNPTGGLGDVAFGHINVIAERPSTLNAQAQLNANTGELNFTRLNRLCTENGIFLSSIAPLNTPGDVDYQGPQTIDTLLNLLRQCEKTDQGTLFDGASQGLFYVTKKAKEGQLAALTIDAATGQLSSPFDVVDNDQRTLNSMTVSRLGGGASATAQDTTSPMSINAIGLYSGTDQISASYDSAPAIWAGWQVSLGTQVGYRYPEVTIDLRKNPSLVPAWLSVQPGDRIDVLNLSSVLPGHPPETLSLLVEGVSQHIDDTGWIGTARCSLYQPWSTASLGFDTPASDDVWVLRADTDSSTVNTSAAQGATSLSVATASGPKWTTTSTDYPLTLEVAGRKVTASACSGTTSPQTFTVSALPVAVSAGAVVRLWQPSVPGL